VLLILNSPKKSVASARKFLKIVKSEEDVILQFIAVWYVFFLYCIVGLSDATLEDSQGVLRGGVELLDKNIKF
jgi:hypothetical protein